MNNKSEQGNMDLALVLFLGIIGIVTIAFVLGASASSNPFDGNIVTSMYSWLVSLFV